MIKTAIKNRYAVIRLNRPEKRNALHPDMMRQFISEMAGLSANDAISAVIISGEGKAFCAGADLDSVLGLSDAPYSENREDTELLRNLFLSIYESPKTIIAAVNGPALAGGCGLAMVCDIVIADEQKSTFGFPEVKIGFLPAIVSYFSAIRIGGSRTKSLMLSGRIISASEAYSLGIADRLAGDVFLAAVETAEEIGKNPIAVTGEIKQMLRTMSGMSPHQAMDYLQSMNFIGRKTPDFKEGIKSFLKKE